MKILIITREFPPNVLGGVGYHSYNLARSLADLNNEVQVLTSDSESHKSDSSQFNFDGIKIEKIEYKQLPGRRIWFNEAVINHIKQKRYSDVDIVHSHEYIDFDKLKTNAKIILKIHYNIAKTEFRSINSVPKFVKPIINSVARSTIWAAEEKLEIQSLKSSDYRIYNSKLAKRIMENSHEYRDNQYRVIYNGVDTSKFSEGNQNEQKKFALFVGGSSERKGFNRIINGYSIAKNPVKLKVVGDLTEKSITNKAKKMSSIDLLGRVDHDELVQLYQEATILLHPALYETFGNVILESLSCGTPVVISNKQYCGAAEILNDDVAKKIEPTGKNIAEIITNNFHWSTSANRCRSVAKSHSWENVAQNTIDFISNVTCK